MKFSTRTRYGLRFLVHLASCPQGQLVQLGELAKEEGISAGYLEQIVRHLKPLGIMNSVRGAAGGYTLACTPQDINMEQVFLHLEGDISPVNCLNNKEQCARENFCTTRAFWDTLDQHFRDFLKNMTLQDVIDKYGTCEMSTDTLPTDFKGCK